MKNTNWFLIIDSGNRLYQTLGNLQVNPLVGVVVPDFASADVLYLTGTASILVGAAASAVMARTQLAVAVTLTGARLVRAGLPFRGAPLERSPYNPPVRHLLAEQGSSTELAVERPDVAATLTNREVLTPTVSRFTFALDGADRDKMRWVPGQHVTLDFGGELDHGYAHMRDDDPQSLNDDFVRTFTVSSAPPSEGSKVVEMQITARRNGPATGLLWRQNLRVPLSLPVLGFGGASSFRLPVTTTSTKPAVFVAGGVGITPLLAQARGVLDAGVPLTLLWSINAKDLPLAADTFARIAGLAAQTTLFVSGGEDGEVVQGGVAGVEYRRMAAADVSKLGGRGSKFYLCTGPALLTALQEWLAEEDVVWEDFGY